MHSQTVEEVATGSLPRCRMTRGATWPPESCTEFVCGTTTNHPAVCCSPAGLRSAALQLCSRQVGSAQATRIRCMRWPARTYDPVLASRTNAVRRSVPPLGWPMRQVTGWGLTPAGQQALAAAGVFIRSVRILISSSATGDVVRMSAPKRVSVFAGAPVPACLHASAKLGCHDRDCVDHPSSCHPPHRD